MKSLLLLPSQQSRHDGTIVRHTRTALVWLATSMLVLSIMLTPQTGATADKEPPFITGLLDLPLSNYYITPRGVIAEDAKLVFQPSLLLFANLYQSQGPLNNVTASVGIWNSIHSKDRFPDSSTPNYFELDFLSGLSFTFLNDWTFSLGFEYWVSPVDAFPSNSLLTLRFGYTDHFLKDLLKGMPGELSINPYINFFIELHNKAAAPVTVDESFYFEFGFTPKYVFAGYPLTLEVPTFFIFPGDHFYSTNSTLGVFGTGVKVTAPLTFIEERYGKWSTYAGFRYYHIANDGVVAGNISVAPFNSNRDPVQFVGGIALNF